MPGFTLTAATSISGDYIVGWGNDAEDGRFRAFRLKRSGVLYQLDVITGGWVSNWAWDVNAFGDIVGAGGMNHHEWTVSMGRAFVFTDQLGFKSLDDLIPQDSGWNNLRGAYSINATGEIVGWGYNNIPGRNAFHLKLPAGQAATCSARNTCGGGDGDPICLFSDGVVEASPGHFIAVFGYDNTAATSVHPSVNEVRLDGQPDANLLAPPPDLQPGTHTAGYVPQFDAGHTLTWTVGLETVTATASSPRLPPVRIGNNGLGVVIGGQIFVIRPDIHGPCTNPPFDDGAPCDDGNACTQFDTCRSGVCSRGTTRDCPALDQCHASGICDPATGSCSNPLRADETPCDDGNACTDGDVCVAGGCTAGLPRSCVASDECQLDGVCNPANGSCTNPPNPNCGGAPPPTATPQDQGTNGTVPLERVGLDPTTGTVTVTSADGVAGVGSSSPTTITIPALVGAVLQCLADMDGDGATDIVFASPATTALRYMRRTDQQMVGYDATPIVIDAAMPSGTPGTAACRDVDGDGRVDIVTSVATPDPTLGSLATIVLYRATTGTFQRTVIPHGFPGGVVVGGLALADFDNDQKLDLVAYAASNQPVLDSQIFVFPNGGTLEPPFSQATRVSVPGTRGAGDRERSRLGRAHHARLGLGRAPGHMGAWKSWRPVPLSLARWIPVRAARIRRGDLESGPAVRHRRVRCGSRRQARPDRLRSRPGCRTAIVPRRGRWDASESDGTAERNADGRFDGQPTPAADLAGAGPCAAHRPPQRQPGRHQLPGRLRQIEAVDLHAGGERAPRRTRAAGGVPGQHHPQHQRGHSDELSGIRSGRSAVCRQRLLQSHWHAPHELSRLDRHALLGLDRPRHAGELRGTRGVDPQPDDRRFAADRRARKLRRDGPDPADLRARRRRPPVGAAAAEWDRALDRRWVAQPVDIAQPAQSDGRRDCPPRRIAIRRPWLER